MQALRALKNHQAHRSDIDRIDRTLLLATGALLVIGFIAVFSATITQEEGRLAYKYLAKQMLHASLGIFLGAMLWVYVPMRRLRDKSALIAVATIGMLALVHLPVIGVATEYGVARWINLGIMTVQPVEIVKIALLLHVCAYCVARRMSLGTLRGFCGPLVLVLVADVLLMTQPDFGSVVLITGMALAIMFMAGARLMYFLVAGGVMAVLATVAAITEPYRLKRLLAFSNPFDDPLGSGYHQTHSLMAFGKGGWFGSGLGQSVEKWAHLPEAHTDFIMSVIAEETGVIGFCVVIVLYGLVMHRAYDIASCAERCGKQFEALLARAIGLLLVVQSFINIGGNLSLLPVKGLTLPLISNGGSSLVAWLVTLALLQAIAADVSQDSGDVLQKNTARAPT